MSTNGLRDQPELHDSGSMRLIALAALLLILFGACQLFSPTPTAVDEAGVFTAGAETVMARLTREAGETAAALLTQIPAAPLPSFTPTVEQPGVPSPTLPAPTLPPLPTATPEPTPTPLSPTPTEVPTPCNLAEFIADLTIPPGSSLPLGSRFIKTWRIRNLGSCVWSEDYALIFSRGDPMGSITIYSFPSTISPGNSIDLSIEFFVPNFPGIYQGEWLLRDPSGVLFGLGVDGQSTLMVQIKAFQPIADPDADFNLAASYCAAAWRSGVGPLGCPGFGGDAAGSVALLQQPNLESGSRRGLTLWTRPDQNRSGWISGRFPAYRVGIEDHFLAEVGCMADSAGCDLNFVLEYQAADGSSGRLGVWRELFDGRTTSIDVDLSSLAGRSVFFTLSMTNNGRPENANGFWLEPRVNRQALSTGLVLDWTRETPGTNACEVLRVYLISPISAEAQAFSCSGGERLLQRSLLTQEEFSQLLTWVQRLKSFDGEVYIGSPNNPISSWFSFSGLGGEDARDADIQAINNFAARVFGRVVGNATFE